MWRHRSPITVAKATTGFRGLLDKLSGTASQYMSGVGTWTNPLSPAQTALDLATNSIGQISFPAVQAASGGANVLDDYEEGTWTPVIGGSGGTSGQTYSVQNGYYVKIGQQVHCSFVVTLSVKGTITTNVQIQGLPFTVSAATNAFSVGGLQWANLATNWVNIILIANTNSTVCLVRGAAAAAATNSTDLTTADINNNTQFIGSISFRATA